MKKIIITELNEKGRAALNKHMKESRKMRMKEKLLFKAAGYKQILIAEENKPLAICLEINSPRRETETFLKLVTEEIEKGLALNGATNEEDYKIEVK